MSTRLPSGQGEDLVCKQRTRGLGTGGLCRGTFETDEEVSSGSSFGKGGAGLQTSASISSKRPGGPRQHLALSPPLILLFPCRAPAAWRNCVSANRKQAAHPQHQRLEWKLAHTGAVSIC